MLFINVNIPLSASGLLFRLLVASILVFRSLVASDLVFMRGGLLNTLTQTLITKAYLHKLIYWVCYERYFLRCWPSQRVNSLKLILGMNLGSSPEQPLTPSGTFY